MCHARQKKPIRAQDFEVVEEPAGQRLVTLLQFSWTSVILFRLTTLSKLRGDLENLQEPSTDVSSGNVVGSQDGGDREAATETRRRYLKSCLLNRSVSKMVLDLSGVAGWIYHTVQVLRTGAHLQQ